MMVWEVMEVRVEVGFYKVMRGEVGLSLIFGFIIIIIPQLFVIVVDGMGENDDTSSNGALNLKTKD